MKKTKKTSLSIKRDILIQNILKSKKSVNPDTVERCDSPEISIMPVDVNQKIDSQENSVITNQSQQISKCKCSLEIKVVARKIYQQILREMELKRKRLIRFKQVMNIRKTRVQDKGTNTSNSTPINLEVIRFVYNETNTSFEMPNNTVSEPITPITNSPIVTFDAKEASDDELPEPTFISPEDCLDQKTNLIEGILAKAISKSKNKKKKSKKLRKSLHKDKDAVNIYENPSKSKSPLQLNLHSILSSSEQETIITNRLSEDSIRSDDEQNSIIKACAKNNVKLASERKNEKPVENNRRDSENFMQDSVLSNTFYLTHINPTLPDEANKIVEACVDKTTDHQIAEESINYISPDLARCAPPEPTVLKELFHIKMKPKSKKFKKQPKIDEIYPVKPNNSAVVTKIKRQDFSHQNYRNSFPFNTQYSSSSPSFECNEKSQPYLLEPLEMLPQLDDLTVNEQETPPSNIEIPKYTKLKIITKKRIKMGKKLLYNKENHIDYENDENADERRVCHERSQADKDENIVTDNNSVMHTEEILKKNTQLINKNAAHRKRKELVKRESPNKVKTFIKHVFNCNELSKSVYSIETSPESLPYNQANEIFSSTQICNTHNGDIVSLSNILSPIVYN